MRKLHAPWNRTCPDCNSTFASVQAIGVCPSCFLIFDVDENGTLIQRRYRIGEEPRQTLSPLESEIKSITRFVRFLESGKITADEFQFNILLYFVKMSDSFWPEVASIIPDAVAQRFREYVREFLVPVDFMPSPAVFMVNTRSEAEIEAKKRELRPKYEALHRFWESRI